ncbi:MAG: hypothetical protein ACPGO5_04700 [Patescibacteria group bacterium]
MTRENEPQTPPTEPESAVPENEAAPETEPNGNESSESEGWSFEKFKQWGRERISNLRERFRRDVPEGAEDDPDVAEVIQRAEERGDELQEQIEATQAEAENDSNQEEAEPTAELTEEEKIARDPIRKFLEEKSGTSDGSGAEFTYQYGRSGKFSNFDDLKDYIDNEAEEDERKAFYEDLEDGRIPFKLSVKGGKAISKYRQGNRNEFRQFVVDKIRGQKERSEKRQFLMNLKAAREKYAAAEQQLHRYKGIVGRLRGNKEKRQQAQQEFDEAWKEYNAMRVEYVSDKANRLMNEQTALAEANAVERMKVLNNTEEMGGFEKLERYVSKMADFMRNSMEKLSANWLVSEETLHKFDKQEGDSKKKRVGKFIVRNTLGLANGRSLVRGGLLAAGVMSGGVFAVAANAGRRSMGAATMGAYAYDKMIGWSKETKMRGHLTQEEIQNLSEDELKQRLSYFEAKANIDGQGIYRNPEQSITEQLRDKYGDALGDMDEKAMNEAVCTIDTGSVNATYRNLRLEFSRRHRLDQFETALCEEVPFDELVRMSREEFDGVVERLDVPTVMKDKSQADFLFNKYQAMRGEVEEAEEEAELEEDEKKVEEKTGGEDADKQKVTENESDTPAKVEGEADEEVYEREKLLTQAMSDMNKDLQQRVLSTRTNIGFKRNMSRIGALVVAYGIGSGKVAEFIKDHVIDNADNAWDAVKGLWGGASDAVAENIEDNASGSVEGGLEGDTNDSGVADSDNNDSNIDDLIDPNAINPNITPPTYVTPQDELKPRGPNGLPIDESITDENSGKGEQKGDQTGKDDKITEKGKENLPADDTITDENSGKGEQKGDQTGKDDKITEKGKENLPIEKDDKITEKGKENLPNTNEYKPIVKGNIWNTIEANLKEHPMYRQIIDRAMDKDPNVDLDKLTPDQLAKFDLDTLSLGTTAIDSVKRALLDSLAAGETKYINPELLKALGVENFADLDFNSLTPEQRAAIDWAKLITDKEVYEGVLKDLDVNDNEIANKHILSHNRALQELASKGAVDWDSNFDKAAEAYEQWKADNPGGTVEQYLKSVADATEAAETPDGDASSETAIQNMQKWAGELADQGFEGLTITQGTVDAEGTPQGFSGEYQGVGVEYDKADGASLVEFDRLHELAQDVKQFLAAKHLGIDFDNYVVASDGTIKGIAFDVPGHEDVIVLNLAVEGENVMCKGVELAEGVKEQGLSEKLIGLTEQLEGKNIMAADNEKIFNAIKGELSHQGTVENVIKALSDPESPNYNPDTLKDYLEKHPDGQFYLPEEAAAETPDNPPAEVKPEGNVGDKTETPAAESEGDANAKPETPVDDKSETPPKDEVKLEANEDEEIEKPAAEVIQENAAALNGLVNKVAEIILQDQENVANLATVSGYTAETVQPFVEALSTDADVITQVDKLDANKQKLLYHVVKTAGENLDKIKGGPELLAFLGEKAGIEA